MKQQGFNLTKSLGIFILCFGIHTMALDFTYQTFRLLPHQAGFNPTKATSLLFVANSDEGILWAGNQDFGRCTPLSKNESQSQNQSIQEGILQCKNLALKVENGVITEVLTANQQHKLNLELLDSITLERHEVTYQYPKTPDTTTHALATIRFHCSKDSKIQKLLQTLYREKFDCENAQRVFVESAQNSIDKAFTTMAIEERKDWKEIIEEFLKTSSFETNVADSLYYFDENLLVFSINDYSYTGGAHGISYQKSVIISKDNKILDLKTIIDFNNPELKSLLWQAYQEYLKNIDEEGFVDFESFNVSEVVLLDYDSFVFVYQPYELMPYAYGILKFRIPLEKMAQFQLKKFGKTPLQSLFAK
ncbi:DUF3298 and DUF4163 domain-containing protein [Helicobacter sp.]|uniref:DUF3298 and DUF4163 domain-containing protein n=1 Tax=Helicobacter sp. TaxID=218 RepID=UPI0019BB0EFF|nr:DUF3298 and DUF4163 domain-containing protein [Helicobacter sp.]MBD5164870.1 DUF3298 and DUF4163 domain-containing protein [Helicobacter sp.]